MFNIMLPCIQKLCDRSSSYCVQIERIACLKFKLNETFALYRIIDGALFLELLVGLHSDKLGVTVSLYPTHNFGTGV